MTIRIPAGDVPVIAEADVAVIGASFAGIACALALAECGRSVAVIEPRTYPGRELTATLRPWLGTAEADEPALVRTVRERAGFGRGGAATGAMNVPDAANVSRMKDAANAPANRTADAPLASGGETPLHPDRLKLCLEDALEAAGIDWLYASMPIDIVLDGGCIAGVVIANKAGRQVVRCAAVADATETRLAARLCGWPGAAPAAAATALYRRTLEWTGVGAVPFGLLPVPERLSLAGGAIRLRPGCRGAGHVYAELALVLPAACSLEADRFRESEARHRSVRLAEYLANEVPAFGRAVWSASSHELYGPLPLSGTAADLFAAAPYAMPDMPSGGIPDLPEGLHLLSGSGDRAGCLPLDAAEAARAGERLARSILAETSGTIRQSAWPSHPSVASAAFAAAPSAAAAASAEVRIPPGTHDRPARTVRLPETALPVARRASVLVAGGGSSGASASITAAREGMDTVLIDLNPGLGGTGTYGGVDSYWFGRRTGFAATIHDAVKKVQQAIRYKGHKWNIEAKAYALLNEAERAGVETVLGAVTFGAVTAGDRVCGAAAATRWGPLAVTADAVIDATGDGDLAAFAGAPFVYGSERDHTVMWYSLAQIAEPAKIRNNFTSMVNVSDIRDYTRAIRAGRRRGPDCHDHGIYVAPRESRHVLGDVVMRLTDQLLQRRWPDIVNIHFSNHDVKGVSGADWINIGLIPPNLEIEVPYRIMLPQGLEGLLVAGKAVSATHDALPAIRMQADLENLGAVAALAAAMAVREGTTPRAIDVASLQRRLVSEGLLPEETLTRTLAPVTYSDAELERLADSIEADRPLYDYANMRMNEVYRGRIPFVEICSVGPRIVPVLERQLERSEGTKRLRTAQALAMLESPAAVPVLVEAIVRELEGRDELPVREADMLYVQLPPDHGAMPDAAYLLYSLAQTRDERAIPVWERVVDLMKAEEDDFRDMRKGLFYYVDAVCQGAERLGSPAAVPVLRRLHAFPALRGQQCKRGVQADYFPERRAMLELAIGRALARCACPDGYAVLIDYLEDVRSLLAGQALLELRRLSGKSFGAEPERWRSWLRERRADLLPQPMTLKLDREENAEALPR